MNSVLRIVLVLMCLSLAVPSESFAAKKAKRAPASHKKHKVAKHKAAAARTVTSKKKPTKKPVPFKRRKSKKK